MSKLRILHLEDNDTDALFVRRALEKSGFDVDWLRAVNEQEYAAAVGKGGFDFILVDSGLPGFSGLEALAQAQQQCPQVPKIVVSGAGNEAQVKACQDAGASDYVLKDHLWQLTAALRRLQKQPVTKTPVAESQDARHQRGLQRLVTAVQELSQARTLPAIIDIVRHAARELTGADGATFVLREGDKCSYVDEDAIGPLWKGQRFPLSACISGWSMLNRQPAVIPDIYADSRIPADAYRPTFVKSLVMVPIRTASPIGAIGNYWASPHHAAPEEVELLQALANTTSVALENVQVYVELEHRVEERTLQLEMTNRELEAFSYSVSHDLRTPIRSISVLTSFLRENRTSPLSSADEEHIARIAEETTQMSGLIDSLLRLAKFARIELRPEPVSLSLLAEKLVARLQASSSTRRVEFHIQPGIEVQGDAGLLQIMLENLLSNAWKYTARRAQGVIEVGAKPLGDGRTACFVRDNGAGFSMSYADKLFQPFQRLHAPDEFTGIGVGLATVQRIVHRHGGQIWAESEVDQGTTFYFTLPPRSAAKTV